MKRGVPCTPCSSCVPPSLLSPPPPGVPESGSGFLGARVYVCWGGGEGRHVIQIIIRAGWGDRGRGGKRGEERDSRPLPLPHPPSPPPALGEGGGE